MKTSADDIWVLVWGCMSASAVHMWEKHNPELGQGTVLEIATVTSDFCSRQCFRGTGRSYDAIGTQ